MNIENKKQIAILLLAISLGVVAAVLTGTHIQNSIERETTRLSQEFETKKMKPLMQEMDSLRKEMKKLASRPVAVAATKEGGEEKSKPEVPKSTLALRTPAGRRAYTVRIDSLSAVGGLVNPGDFVDVLAHLDMPDPITNKKDRVTSMIFQNIQILAVGTNLQAPGGYEEQQQQRALNITFALTPEECGLISFIEKNGQMQLVLRAPAETETQIMQVSTWTTLADYVFEKQGTELIIPRGEAPITPVQQDKKTTVTPFIEIFEGGRSKL
jgi:pilus assembly protein CpaB